MATKINVNLIGLHNFTWRENRNLIEPNIDRSKNYVLNCNYNLIGYFFFFGRSRIERGIVLPKTNFYLTLQPIIFLNQIRHPGFTIFNPLDHTIMQDTMSEWTNFLTWNTKKFNIYKPKWECAVLTMHLYIYINIQIQKKRLINITKSCS